MTKAPPTLNGSRDRTVERQISLNAGQAPTASLTAATIDAMLHVRRGQWMRTVGVIGAGQMGTGIAHTIAQFGMAVLLSDVDLARAEAGKAAIERAVTKLVGRGKIEADAAESLMSRITPVADYAPMADAQLIIEAATEKEQIKQAIFESAGKVLGANAIMASNTSSIPITRMANHSPDPERFIGLHFFNPVPVMGLIEVIPGLATSQATTDEVTAFADGLG